MHITETGSIQLRIDFVPKEKALHAATEDWSQSASKNGTNAEVYSVVMNLAALYVMVEADSALHNLECPSRGLARSLCRAKQSLKERWQDKHESYWFQCSGVT